MKKITLPLVLAVLVASDAHAIITSGGTKRKNSQTVQVKGKSDPDGASSAQRTNSKVSSKASVKRANVEVCRDENYVPLQLLSLTSESEGESIVVEDNIRTEETPKKITIEHKSYLKTCTDYKYEAIQNEGSNNVVVSVRNEYDFDEELGKVMNDDKTTPKYPKDVLDGMSTNQKYEACLELKGILVKNGEEGEIRWPEEDIHYASATATAEVNFDPLKPMRIVFGSPLQLGKRYGAVNGEVKDPGIKSCHTHEEVTENGIAPYTANDIETAKLLDICETGTHDQIRSALKSDSLKSKSLGNAEELRQILEQALQRELLNMADNNYKRMEELAALISSGKDEESIRPYVTEYLDKLVEIRKYVVGPSIAKLENLLKKRGELKTTDKAREEIDKQILVLNQQIGHFEKNERKYRAARVIDQMLEFGFRDAAEDVADFKLKSKFFSNVYAEAGKKAHQGRGDKISFERAQRLVDGEFKRFEKRSAESERVFNARFEDMKYTPQIASGIAKTQAARDRTFQKDMAKIQSYQQACQYTAFGFVQSPARCSYGQKNQQKWVQQAYSRRGRYNNIIRRESNRHEAFTSFEDEGRRRRVAEMGEDGEFGEANSDYLGTYGNFDYDGGGGQDAMFNMQGQPGGNFAPTGPFGNTMSGPNPYGGMPPQQQQWGPPQQQWGAPQQQWAPQPFADPYGMAY